MWSLLLLAVIFACQWYVMSFNSKEGKDERGKEIRYKTNNALFGVVYLGILILYSMVESFEIIPLEYLPDILLWFFLSISVIGAILTYINKNSKNY